MATLEPPYCPVLGSSSPSLFSPLQQEHFADNRSDKKRTTQTYERTNNNLENYQNKLGSNAKLAIKTNPFLIFELQSYSLADVLRFSSLLFYI